MGFDIVSKLTQAGQTAGLFVRRKWEESKSKKTEEAEAAEQARRCEERNRFFALIAAKRTGTSAGDMPPLICEPGTSRKAVFLVTTPISFGRFEFSKSTYRLLARHVGMSINSVSHWLVAVIDRGLGPCYYYELMSDQMALTAIGKNYFRSEEITQQFIETWNSCYYIGETTQSHEQIQKLGENHMALHPRYHLLSNNCQDMVERLVEQLCNGKIISQAKLKEELSLASPRIALDLMVARLRSRMDREGHHDDVDVEKIEDESAGVREDVDVIRSLWHKVHHR